LVRKVLVSHRTGHYSIEQVAELTRAGKVVPTKHVVPWLTNHDYDAKETIEGVLLSLDSHGEFVSSCALHNGEIADEYLVRLELDDRYLKFWIDHEQLVVDVYSCWWDGAVH
jgi:hypothetical protein